MEKCLYQDKKICAYDVKINNVLNWDLRKEWRREAELGNLRCEHCNQEVELRAGKMKVPYFAHKKGNVIKCTVNEEYYRETEEHKKVKLLLYSYFKEKYPNCFVEPRHIFEGNRKADIYVEFDNGKELVIEFQRSALSFIEWEKRHEFYKNKDIKDYWFLSGKEDCLEKIKNVFDMTFFEQLVLNEVNDKMAIYLNVENEMIYTFKRIIYSWEETPFAEHLFNFSSPLKDVIINENGIMIPNYDEAFTKVYDEFEQECEERIKEIINKKEEEKAIRDALQKQKVINVIKKPQEKESNEYRKTYEKQYNGYVPDKPKSYWYIKHVRNAINENEESIKMLEKAMHKSPEHFELIRELFRNEYRRGNKKAEYAYRLVESRAGMG